MFDDDVATRGLLLRILLSVVGIAAYAAFIWLYDLMPNVYKKRSSMLRQPAAALRRRRDAAAALERDEADRRREAAADAEAAAELAQLLAQPLFPVPSAAELADGGDEGVTADHDGSSDPGHPRRLLAAGARLLLSRLPREVSDLVLGFLPARELAGAAARVGRVWAAHAGADRVWKPLWRARFGPCMCKAARAARDAALAAAWAECKGLGPGKGGVFYDGRAHFGDGGAVLDRDALRAMWTKRVYWGGSRGRNRHDFVRGSQHGVAGQLRREEQAVAAAQQQQGGGDAQEEGQEGKAEDDDEGPPPQPCGCRLARGPDVPGGYSTRAYGRWPWRQLYRRDHMLWLLRHDLVAWVGANARTKLARWCRKGGQYRKFEEALRALPDRSFKAAPPASDSMRVMVDAVDAALRAGAGAADDGLDPAALKARGDAAFRAVDRGCKWPHPLVRDPFAPNQGTLYRDPCAVAARAHAALRARATAHRGGAAFARAHPHRVRGAELDAARAEERVVTHPACRDLLPLGTARAALHAAACAAVNAPADNSGNTLLLVAAQHGRRRICRLLVAKGANPDHQNAQGHTALHFAMSFRFYELGGWLVARPLPPPPPPWLKRNGESGDDGGGGGGDDGGGDDGGGDDGGGDDDIHPVGQQPAAPQAKKNRRGGAGASDMIVNRYGLSAYDGLMPPTEEMP